MIVEVEEKVGVVNIDQPWQHKNLVKSDVTSVVTEGFSEHAIKVMRPGNHYKLAI